MSDAAAPILKIKHLLKGIECYNPVHIEVLEEHVNWQIKCHEYDFESNLALLRLYQFYPEHFNVDVTKFILLYSLCNLDPVGFNLCKYLIQLDHLNDEPLSSVVDLGLLLESCQFPEFWTRLHENINIVEGLPGFREAMIKFIVSVVTQTYQCISKPLLMQFLDVTDAELHKIIQENGWSEDTNEFGTATVLVSKHEESVKSVKIHERVNFDAISSLSGAFRPSKGEFFIKSG